MEKCDRMRRRLLGLFLCLVVMGTSLPARAEETSGRSRTFGQKAALFQAEPWTRQGDAYYSADGTVINGAIARGIDVSSNNGPIDWMAVKNDGVEFAILRCGYGENLLEQDDARWQENAAGCQAAGIPYGVYLYSYADSVSRAVSEAEHVLRLIRGHVLSYPVYLDIEDPSIFARTTAQQREEIAEAFCSRIEAAGYTAGVYASVSTFTNLLIGPAFDGREKWVAHYSGRCGYGGVYRMWQATNQGQVAGIMGKTDLNFLMADHGFLKPRIKAARAAKKSVRLSFKPKKKGTTCHIYYGRKKKGPWRHLKKGAGKGKAVVRKLKSGKKYYFKIKISRKIRGVTVYSDFSNTIAVKVR